MIIKVRRGLEANRLSYTPKQGEPTFTTDTKKLYIGDGVTPGGILVDMSGGGIVQTIVAGSNITVDNTDPTNPVVSATGGGGAVDSVNGKSGEVVLNADDIGDGTTYKRYSSTEKTKLSGIETGADVTDATNVQAAGALMDSEVTNLAAVKAFDPTDYATSTQGGKADTAVQPGDLADVATSGDYDDLENKPSVPASVDDLSPSQSGNSGKFLKTDGTNASWESIPGGGDMLATTYDPNNKSADAFSMGNMVETSTKKIMSDTERTKLSGIETGADVTDAANVDAAGATMNTDTNVKSNSWVLDQDNMSGNDDTKVPTQQSVKAYVDAAVAAAIAAMQIPVGGLYFSTNSTNPGTSLGYGTWSAFGAGRVPVGYDSGQTEFNTDEKTGGSKKTWAQIRLQSDNLVRAFVDSSAPSWSANQSSSGTYGVSGQTATIATPVMDANGNTAAANLQPYIVVRMWKRTA